LKIAEFLTFKGSDRVILHTVMHHSSTSTYIPNFIEIEEICLWTYGRAYGHLRPTLLGQLGGVDLINQRSSRLTNLLPKGGSPVIVDTVTPRVYTAA